MEAGPASPLRSYSELRSASLSAVRHRQLDLLRELMRDPLFDPGLFRSETPEHKRTLIHEATRWPDVLELLLTHPRARSCLESVDLQGETPLLVALRERNDAAARLLIGAGANVKFLSPLKRSVLHLCRDPELAGEVSVFRFVLFCLATCVSLLLLRFCFVSRLLLLWLSLSLPRLIPPREAAL